MLALRGVCITMVDTIGERDTESEVRDRVLALVPGMSDWQLDRVDVYIGWDAGVQHFYVVMVMDRYSREVLWSGGFV